LKSSEGIEGRHIASSVEKRHLHSKVAEQDGSCLASYALSQRIDMDSAYALHQKAHVSRGRRILLSGKLRNALILQAILNPPYIE